LKVEIIEKIDWLEYDSFLDSVNSTFFHSSKFLKLLNNLLEAKNLFIKVKDGNEISGIIPMFVKDTKYGKVQNSLPYFGSYGGVLSKKIEISKLILNELNNFNQENEVLSSVIIENPFSDNNIYEKFYKFNSTDTRLCQCTILDKSENELFNSLEKRVRWSLKKSDKEDIEVKKLELNKEIISELYRLHKNNMEIKGGQVKNLDFFKYIKKIFCVGKDYDVYGGFYNDKPISFLLVFYHTKFTEYYMPVQNSDYKNLQSSSKLIWESIKESLNQKKHYYNFGGTPKNNESLYRFKRGWNANDYNYRYYVYRDLERLKEIDLNELKKLYENFYVFPYDDIQKNH